MSPAECGLKPARHPAAGPDIIMIGEIQILKPHKSPSGI
jgi:hypothetical protein